MKKLISSLVAAGVTAAAIAAILGGLFAYMVRELGLAIEGFEIGDDEQSDDDEF